MIPSSVFIATVALHNKFALSSKFSRNPGSMPKKYRRVSSTSGKDGKYIAGFLVKSSVAVVGVRCCLLLAVKYIPAQKIMSVSTKVNHNCSALVLYSGNGVCYHHSSVYIRALYTTARVPNLTCEAISPGRNTFCQ